MSDRQLLEPEAEALDPRPSDITSLRSIAISLKRIADVAEKIESTDLRKVLFSAGSDFAFGMRGRG